MDNPTILLIISIAILVIAAAVLIGLLFSIRSGLRKDIVDTRREMMQGSDNSFTNLRTETAQNSSALRAELLQILSNQSAETTQTLSKQSREMLQTLSNQSTEMLQLLSKQAIENEQKLENMRKSMLDSLREVREDNSKQLENMRATVDEKLQKTLEERIGQSFKLVSERLEKVSEGLGEMQTLAAGVGDLKKVLSNVKTRGILGEIQLGAILKEILSPDQYEENVATVKGSSERVEFAIKLPGDEKGTVYLPIDAKFPGDAYANLIDAYDSGIQADIDASAKHLDQLIRGEAKKIHEKYVQPPETTDFAIMFLPVEGLYAEVVRRGLVEDLQIKYKINIAGPTTMAALLNSLQMGFRTLAIQKRSGEVWDILSAVKTEFIKFGDVLEQAQNRINQANSELDKLVGVRTRAIQRTLSKAEELSSEEDTTRLIDIIEE